MVFRPPRFGEQVWNSLSFPSTLYLGPVLDLLLTNVPLDVQLELRLGLQEALVNAAKHGNGLDTSKVVSVRYRVSSQSFSCVIADQGAGFHPPQVPCSDWDEPVPCEHQECGRGLFILYQVFDQVEWNERGTELVLHKQFRDPVLKRLAALTPSRLTPARATKMGRSRSWLRASLF